MGFPIRRGGGPGHQGEGSARARRTRVQSPRGAARVALTAIKRRRENETTQHRNARDPERRWVARARAPRARADQRGLASGQAAIAPNAEHTLRLEYSYADPNTGNGPGNTERRACPKNSAPLSKKSHVLAVDTGSRRFVFVSERGSPFSTASIHARYKPTSDTRIYSTQCATANWHPTGSKTFGRINAL